MKESRDCWILQDTQHHYAVSPLSLPPLKILLKITYLCPVGVTDGRRGLGEGLFKVTCLAFDTVRSNESKTCTDWEENTSSQEKRAPINILEMGYKCGSEFSCSQNKEKKAIIQQHHSIHKLNINLLLRKQLKSVYNLTKV